MHGLVGGLGVGVLLRGLLECGCSRLLFYPGAIGFCGDAVGVLHLRVLGGLGLKNWDFPVALWFAGVHAGVLSDARRFWCVVASTYTWHMG